jgi:hypothetical protein
MSDDRQSSSMILEELRSNLYNEIVQPDVVFVATQYFRRNWAPRLGSNLTLLVLALRQRCYWNKKEGDSTKRDWCIVDHNTLAEEIGVSRRTVINLLAQPEAGRFLQVKARYRYDNRLGKRVKAPSLYRVRMDDPLTPEDQALLENRLQEALAGISVDPETGQMDMAGLLEQLSGDGAEAAHEPPYREARLIPDLATWQSLGPEEVIVEWEDRFWVVPIREVVAWDLQVNAGRIPSEEMATYCFFSVAHARGEGPQDWQPEEMARIEQQKRLFREMSRLYEELGAYSLEAALEKYFGRDLASRFLEQAQEDGQELERIRAWVAYTRRASNLTSPGGFLRLKLESDEVPPG